MATNKFYYGSKHTFTTREDDSVIELAKGVGEELYIEELRTQAIYYSEESDDLGLNQLGTAINKQHTNTTVLKKQGTSVSIADVGEDAYLAVGSPATLELGGVGPYKYTDGGTFVETGALTQISFTSSAQNGLYSDINEDGDLIIFTDAAANSSTVQTYRRSVETWSASDIITGAGLACKVSSTGTSDYLLSGDLDGSVMVHLYSGSWVLQQTLLASSASSVTNMDIVNANTAVYYSAGAISVWTRILTTWTNIQNISLAGVTGLSLKGTVLAAISSGTLYIYQRDNELVSSTFALINSFDITGIVSVCTNGTYVFCNNATAVRIYQKINISWVRSFNNTTITSTYEKMACSNNWLVIGQPTFDTNNGRASVYPISDYVSSLVETNRITLSGTNMTLSSTYGSVIIDSPTTDSFDDGSVSAPSIFFTDQTTTGLYRPSSNTVGIAMNGANGLLVSETQLLGALGTVSLPSLSFISDPDTGLYRKSANILGLAAGGVNSLSLSSTQLQILDGSASVPGLCFGADTNTGIYRPTTDQLAITGAGSFMANFTPNGCSFTAVLADNMNAYVTGTAAPSIANNTQTTLNSYWNGTPQISVEVGAVQPTFASGVWTINRTGRYFVGYSIAFSANATGTRQAFSSGTALPTNALHQKVEPCTTGRTVLSNFGVFIITAGSTLSIDVLQTSGGALAMDVFNGYFILQRIC